MTDKQKIQVQAPQKFLCSSQEFASGYRRKPEIQMVLHSKSLVYPYPTKFDKPHGYPTKFDKPQYPTAFIKPNQIQMETQTNEDTFMSKWENAIHQLIVQTHQRKGPAVCVSAPETENASRVLIFSSGD